MRFAIYIRTVASARGAERVTVNIARGLAARGHDIDFLVEEDGAWLTRDLQSQYPNVRVLCLGDTERQPAGWLWRLLTLLALIPSAPRAVLADGDSGLLSVGRLLWKDQPPIRALHRYLQDERPHAIVSFLNYPNMVLLLTAALGTGGARVVVSVRNHISTSAQQNESRWVRSVPRLMRRLFRRADIVVAPSQGVADDVVSITGLAAQRVRVIYNPVMRAELAGLADAPVEHRWFDKSGVPILVAAGKMKPQKDFPTLLRAFAQVRAVRPARLILLGEGKEQEALQQLSTSLGIAEDVDFPGYVENPYPFYRRASLFVLSSAWEGLPNVLIEAMACGCPVVSTDCPSGPSEILEGGRYGRLVPVGSPDALATAILAALSEPPSPAALLQRARCFSLDRAAEQFEAVLSGSVASMKRAN